MTRWGAVGWRPVAAGASAACAGRSPRSRRRARASAIRSWGCRNRCSRRPRPCSCRVNGEEARCRRGRADDSPAARLPQQRVWRLRYRQRRRAGRCPTSSKKGRRGASCCSKAATLECAQIEKRTALHPVAPAHKRNSHFPHAFVVSRLAALSKSS